jgi:hypothetical protein
MCTILLYIVRESEHERLRIVYHMIHVCLMPRDCRRPEMTWCGIHMEETCRRLGRWASRSASSTETCEPREH